MTHRSVPRAARRVFSEEALLADVRGDRRPVGLRSAPAGAGEPKYRLIQAFGAEIQPYTGIEKT